MRPRRGPAVDGAQPVAAVNGVLLLVTGVGFMGVAHDLRFALIEPGAGGEGCGGVVLKPSLQIMNGV